MSEITCADCGGEVERRGRGKPPSRCVPCQVAYRATGRRAEKRPTTKKCKRCGTPFFYDGTPRKYCSDACFDLRRVKTQPNLSECVTCGAALTAAQKRHCADCSAPAPRFCVDCGISISYPRQKRCVDCASPPARVCAECGTPLGHRQKKFCTDRCMQDAANAERRRKTAEQRAKPVNCKECGALVPQNPVGRKMEFCNPEHRGRFHGRRMNRQRQGVGVLADRICGYCGDPYTPGRRNQVYCSHECYLLGNRTRPKFVPFERQCDDCGTTFTARASDHRFDTIECQHRFHSREASRTRRSPAGNAQYSDIAIFERDRWMCHICKKAIDPTVSRMKPDGATIDHITPISLGGPDIESNVAAAHRQCNLLRSTLPVAFQMRLI